MFDYSKETLPTWITDTPGCRNLVDAVTTVLYELVTMGVTHQFLVENEPRFVRKLIFTIIIERDELLLPVKEFLEATQAWPAEQKDHLISEILTAMPKWSEAYAIHGKSTR